MHSPPANLCAKQAVPIPEEIALSSHGSVQPSRRLSWAGYLLGFSLGGFFDGILLHQVLQWHHLLSELETAPFADVRVQILADGLFHLAMYLVALAGLWQLWRSRPELTRPGADRWLLAGALIGFGAWHAIDAVLSHWLLGIHRIRMDTEMPLLWDLGWLFAFGISALAAGWRLRRRVGGPPPARPGLAALMLGLAIVLAAPVAALPPPGSDNNVMVVFTPGTSPVDALDAIIDADGGILWSDASGMLWAVRLPDGRRPSELYRRGALLVSRSFLAAACFAWSNGNAREAY